jgi:Fe-S-cluster containining protein
MRTPVTHPCLSCGACCAHFRISLHWSEADAALGGTVPSELTEPYGRHQRAMLGTGTVPVRCIALEGDIGRHAPCRIYAQRPQVCRDLKAAWEQGQPSPQCDRARAAHGMPPLTPADWEGPV